ncbi:MAG: hypothetical protein HPY83_00420 [Anaerolineae bacterium]|nr:hypothetical protein [Anaerolineae bacterium]
MKLSVGYRLPADEEDDWIASIVAGHRQSVAEAYFACEGMASGRAPVGWRGGEVDRTGQGGAQVDCNCYQPLIEMLQEADPDLTVEPSWGPGGAVEGQAKLPWV